jgi:hypothetical protein
VKLKKVAALGAALGVIAAGAAFTAPAHADPTSDGYSIVGSDTLQDAVSALANGYSNGSVSVQTTGLGKYLASWDAFTLGVSGGVGKIQTKPFGPVFDRPNGSGAGRTALLRSINYAGSTVYNTVNVAGQVDLARSSSKGAADANGVLQYLPFGQDAISYVYKAGTGVDAASLTFVASLSQTQLGQIYGAATTTAVSGTDDHIKAIGLQTSSGTWTTFLGKVGLAVGTLGAGVDTRGNTVPENDGNVLTPVADEIQIIPISVANYIAQANGVARINTVASVTLGSPDAVNAPFTGTAPNLVPNQAFYSSSTWGRTVFIVVPYAKTNPADPSYDAGLSAIVDPTATTSLTYWGASGSPTTSKAVKIKFGFAQPVDTAFRSNA